MWHVAQSHRQGARSGRGRLVRAISVACAAMCFPVVASAQVSGSPEPDRADAEARLTLTRTPTIRPMTSSERKDWIVDGIAGPKSLALGTVSATWQSAIDSPREWGGSSGFAKRYLSHEADTAISKSLEGGLGALWGEDPRPIRSGREKFWPRLGYAMKTVVLAPRPDGHLAPAWGRFAGNLGSNVLNNAWLPSRLATPKGTAMRTVDGLLGRLATNLWTEFGPDLRRRFSKHRSSETLATASAR